MAISQNTDAKRPQVLRQIAELHRLPMPELTERWRVLMGATPRRITRRFY